MNIPKLRGKSAEAILLDTEVNCHVSGAIPNGARFVKVEGDPEDLHKIGEQGRIKGSVRNEPGGEIAYFVRFDDTPTDAVVFLRGYKIREIGQA
jgi:hypothetical protein